MLTDSPYEISEFVLPPSIGALVGLGAGALVALALYAGFAAPLGPLLGLSEPNVSGAMVAGALLTGAAWGALYGCSQQEIPTPYLYGVASFFALFLWVVDNLGLRLFFHNPDMNHAAKTGSGFFLHLLFTLCLATSVVIKRQLAPKNRTILPKD